MRAPGKGAPRPLRPFRPGQSGQVVQRATGDAQGHRGDTKRQQAEDRKGIGRRVQPRPAPGQRQAARGRHQDVGHLHVAGAGAAQARDVPGVVQHRLGRREQEQPHLRPGIATGGRLAGGRRRHQGAPQQPLAIGAAAGPGPAAAQPVAAVHPPCPAQRRVDAARDRRQAAVRRRKDRPGFGRRQPGRGQRRGRGNHHAPARGAVRPRDLANRREALRRHCLRPTAIGRQEQMHQSVGRQAGGKIRRQAARRLDLRRPRRDRRCAGTGCGQRVGPALAHGRSSPSPPRQAVKPVIAADLPYPAPARPGPGQGAESAPPGPAAAIPAPRR